MGYAAVEYPSGTDLAVWGSKSFLNQRALIGEGYVDEGFDLVESAALSAMEAMGYFLRHARVQLRLRPQDIHRDNKGYLYLYRSIYPVRSVGSLQLQHGGELAFGGIESARIYFDSSSATFGNLYGFSADLATIEIECGYLPTDAIPGQVRLLLGAIYAQMHHTRTLHTETDGGSFTQRVAPAATIWMDTIRRTNGGITLPEVAVAN